MSVWKQSCYRDDALQWALRNLNEYDLLGIESSKFLDSLYDIEIEEFGSFPVPKGLKPGNLKEQLKKGGINHFTIHNGMKSKQRDDVTELLLSMPEAVFGLPAVYAIASEFLKKSKLHKLRQHKDKTFFKYLAHCGAAGSNRSAGDILRREDTFDHVLAGQYEYFQEVVRELLLCRGYWRSQSQRRDNYVEDAYMPVDKSRLKHLREYDVYSLPGAVILHKDLIDKCWLILNKDIDRIDKILSAFGAADIYARQYGGGKIGLARKMTEKVEAYKTHLISALDKKGKHNHVCRAYDVAHNWIISETMARDDFRANKEQREKFHNEKLHEIFSLSSYKTLLSGLAFKELLEISNIHKCLPTADFDYFGAAYRQETMYQENVAEAIRDKAAEGPIFEDVLNYHKWYLIFAYHKLNGKCPGKVINPDPSMQWVQKYPYVSPRYIPQSEVHRIDLNGDFIWNFRGEDILDLVKDKAICPSSINGTKTVKDHSNLPSSLKNQLLDVLGRTVPIDLQHLEGKRKNIFYDLKADDKPEAKKPNARWFFEAHTEARLKQSQFEDAIHRYVLQIPGSMIGKKYGDKVRLMNAVTQSVVEAYPYKQLYISFDIKKFSPYLPVKVHERITKHWAEAFGLPSLKEANRILTDGDIHYIKGPIHHKFRKYGADFEGFMGKQNTAYHCAVMGTAARYLRERNITPKPVRFCALIDDGLLRLMLKRDSFEEDKKRALSVIEQVYNAAGLRISWDKTYCSSCYAQFLNEQRYLGRSITPGLKSALKITNRADVPAANMRDDLQMLRSTTQGSIVAGAPPICAYFLYLRNVITLINKWWKSTRKRSIRWDSAIRCFIPIDYGGLGLSGIMQLSGSVGSSQTSESLGILKCIGYRFNGMRPIIKKFLIGCTSLTESSHQRLNPGSVKTSGVYLRNDRLHVHLARALAQRSSAPVFKAIFDTASVLSPDFLTLMLDGGSIIPKPLRESFYELSPSAIFRELSMKFLRSATVLTFLPRRILVRTRHAYRKEAERVLEEY